MRVLHFGRFYNDQFGGIERHVHLLLKQLATEIEVDNLVANDSPETEVIHVDGFRVIKAPAYGVSAGVAVSPAMIRLARNLHRENPYDILHLHLPDPLSHLTALCLPRSVKVVATWHSDVVRQRHLLKLYQPFMGHFLRQRVDAVIAATPGHFLSSTQLGALVEEKRRVIPYGLDFAFFDKAETQVAAQKIRADYPGKFIIFAVGRHVYYKGFPLLIEAMRNIRDAVLILGGSGPLSGELHAQVQRLGLEDRIVLTGRIPDKELPAYYHAADIFCMPSIECSEAFGIVQLEAMACGKPVVCCELNNGVTYVNQHMQTGLVVPANNVVALGQAITQLQYSPELRETLGRQARERARMLFSAEQMGAKTLALYRSLLSPP